MARQREFFASSLLNVFDQVNVILVSQDTRVVKSFGDTESKIIVDRDGNPIGSTHTCVPTKPQENLESVVKIWGDESARKLLATSHDPMVLAQSSLRFNNAACAQLEGADVVIAAETAEKILYTSANGQKYEIVQRQF